VRSHSAATTAEELSHCDPYVLDNASEQAATTSLGAGCFLVCALATLSAGRTLKSPRLPRIHELEHAGRESFDSQRRSPIGSLAIAVPTPFGLDPPSAGA
jgi:hypothetical protein